MSKTSYSERLGLLETSGALTPLDGRRLPEPEKILQDAYALGPKDPQGAQHLLAAGILSAAHRAEEGRLCGALILLSRLVATADPMKTLGPAGSELRLLSMPNGWTYTITSWFRLRYAWLTGLPELLDLGKTDDPLRKALGEAIEEMVRLHEGEPEPTAIILQEQWPPPKVALAISLLGIGISVWSTIALMKAAKK